MKRSSYHSGSKTTNHKGKQRKVAKPKTVPRSVSIETKTLDLLNNTLNFDNNSAVANCMRLLNPVPTNINSQSRIGKRINGKAIQIRGQIRSSTATLYEKCAVLLIWVRSPNLAATLPAVTDILTSQTSNALTNLSNAPKYKILRRWELTCIGNTTTPSTGQELHCFDEYVPLKSLKYETLYDQTGSTGAINEIEKGALILLTVGNSANAAATTPVFIFNTRYYFDDM